VTSYFSNQQRFTIPACIVRPTSAPEISSALTIITQYGCHFAVKSGGHASFKGASNSDGGITIDLSAIRELEISDDKATTRVGTGLRWGEVYDVLEPQGLTVIGGRDTGVGVGGFLLGGESFLLHYYRRLREV
jgi:FAD/FMN-containing dehydrogenase